MRTKILFASVIIFCISIILNLSLVSEIMAENINTSAGESIQSKINIALTNSDDIDYIYIAAGTFEEQIIIVISPGKEIHLVGSGSDATIISLPASMTGNVISCDGGGKIFLDDMKIMNGNRSGILNKNMTEVTLNNCIIENNFSTFGGGINNVGKMTINNCSINNNSSDLNGGGIYNDGSLIITDSKIINNSSSLSTGGGIYNAGSLNISNSTIANNSDGIDTISTQAGNIAADNWWGTESGPYNASENPLGTGNSVSDNINFNPFLISDPFLPPVQPPDENNDEGGSQPPANTGNNTASSNDKSYLNGSYLVFQEGGSFSRNHYLNSYGSSPGGFIALLYHSVLGREPDAEGFGLWQEVLESQSKSASEIAECFFFSEENISRLEAFDNNDFIEYLYLSILFRNYDISGYEDCLKCMNAGVSKRYLFDAFTNSEEWNGICAEFKLNP
ncbi:MAG: DUF4214 domain-containing protein [Candidatus Humimicrobiaceae bacterium]